MNERITTLSVSPTPTGFHLSGEIDSSTAEPLAGHLREGADTASDLEILMRDVHFIDSSGLRILIEAHQEAEKRGRRLIIVEPSPIVVRLLGISGLTEYLHVRLSSV